MNEKQIKYAYYALVAIGAIFLLNFVLTAFIAKNDDGVQSLDSVSYKQNDSYDLDKFAKCINEKGAVLYGAYWCPHCKNQMMLFGNSTKYIKYIECQTTDGSQTEECVKAGIKAYPTWIINNQQYIGEKKLTELASLTGCKLV